MTSRVVTPSVRARSLFGLFIVGLVAIVFVVVRPRAAPPSEAAALPLPEKPWFSKEAADQVFGADNQLGPLFTGIVLGGSPPSAEIRAQIAAFARANDVQIDFEVDDDELVAVRFDVTFGGCCGYEGVDKLARGLGRPGNGGGCGMPFFFYDNWAIAHDDGTHFRARVRVNRLSVRWEKALALEDVLARAEAALGADRAVLADAAGDRFTTLESGKRFLLEAPYRYSDTGEWRPSRALPANRGIELVTSQRFVTEVSFTTDEERARRVLRQRWGKPRTNRDDNTWTWYQRDRTITASSESDRLTVTLVRR